MKAMKSGDTVKIESGIAHAIYTLENTEFIALFDYSPKEDRERVPVLVF